MAYRYDKLLGKIVEVFGNQEKFADAMNISPQTLSGKLNNKTDWRRDEIYKAMKLLKIDASKIADYFFSL